MAVVIAAPASGSGKTLISLALLSWARARGESVQPFKVGPDYLDPQLLSEAAGRSCRNLDLNLCGEPWVRKAFHGYGGNGSMALIEGVMGLFDGIGSTEEGSTAAIARLLHLPVVLVVDAGGQAASLGALVRGFRDHDPRLNLAGVVINRVNSDRHRALLQDVLDRLGVPLLGCMPRTDALQLPSRHLGLAPAHELDDLAQRRQAWADLAEQHLDLSTLAPLMRAPAAGPSVFADIPPGRGPSLPVAVAADAAFHFRYPETGELLEHLGMPAVPWSPLADEAIPKEAKGLILPGGFPEQHAAQISQAIKSLNSLRQFCHQRPVYAECGGMLLLGRHLSDLDGNTHPMANVLPFEARRGRLQVGYRRLKPRGDGLLVKQGEQFTGHEFHRWELVDSRGADDGSVLWEIDGWRVSQRPEGWNKRTLHAS
ncbi:MAG: cobyrinate a,c-diamide synthase, partial [Synechococcus sp. cluster2_bin.209]|nr:cobyrinate a,c-diamide synthase [Synechococcus sp. cluster2_bin.209]